MKKIITIIMAFVLCFSMSACDINEKKTTEYEIPKTLGDNLIWDHSLELDYATEFTVDYYINEDSGCQYKLITIANETQYLIVPEAKKAPGGLSEDIVIIQAPHRIYLVASQVMDMIVSINALDDLKYSALKSEDWYIDEAKAQMEDGKLLYAGKYSAPDYELIMQKGCDLAIENTMIYHSPEVKEKLESFDIPVLVDRSSYESEPLGRTEWVKLYGALTGHEAEAQAAFDDQVKKYKAIVSDKSIDPAPTVAFFYISANGDVKVRKSGDYLPKMIAMAGGKYIFSDLGNEEDNASSTINMQMEEFYKNAKNADYMIYNSTIEGELTGINDLLKKSELLSNAKAVKEGKVYCTAQNLYQSTMELGTIISDIHKMLTDDKDMTYLYHLE